MAKPLRVLILEDRAADAELIVLELRRAGFSPQWSRVDTREDYLAHLAAQLADLRPWHAVTLGRETRIIELKHEVNRLLARARQRLRYPNAEKHSQWEKNRCRPLRISPPSC